MLEYKYLISLLCPSGLFACLRVTVFVILGEGVGGGEPETVNRVQCFLLVHFLPGLLERLALQLSPGRRYAVEFLARVCTVYATKVLLISVTPFDFFLI